MRKHPLIWGHRGASGYAPENTLPAFQLAAKMGADGVELDVQLTKDGELVVCHDETIDRTSNAKGWIKDFSLDELKKLDFSNGNFAYEGVQIPTLGEVLELLTPTGLTVNVEIKTGIVFYPGIEGKVLGLVHDMHWEERILYSSFNHETLRNLRRIDSNVRTGVLYSDGLVDVIRYGRNLGANALHPAFYNLHFPGFLDDCKNNDIEVNVWTVDETEQLEYCKNINIHAVITNYPDKAKRVFSNI